ncbi:SGNH/GDSL hydrolase family protein, partial [Coprococcus eutactus]|nr:SGNH/GDSL hydrolase family protein [Coprococcus eutactus]
KKDRRHNLIKMIAFAKVFVVILGVLGVALTPKRSDPGSGITNSNPRGFYGEPKNSIDVLILGDSNTYSACSPMYIWNR